MIKRIIKHTVIILFVVSCTQPKNHQNKAEIIIKIPEIHYKAYNYNNIYSSMSYLRLNSNDTILLRTIRKAKVCDTLIYIFDSSNIYIYSNKGNVVNHLKRGKGPGECIRPINFTISPTKELEVLDNGNTIKVYSLTGVYKRKYNIHKWDMINIEHLNDSIILLFTGRYSKTKNHLLYAYNTNKDSIVKSFFNKNDYTKDKLNGGALLFNNTFQKTSEGVLLTTSLPDNNIYLIDNDLNLKIKYHVDFGNKKIPDIFFTNYTKNGKKDRKKLMSTDFIHTISNFHVFNNYSRFIFSGTKGTRGYRFIGNIKQNIETKVIDRLKLTDNIVHQHPGIGGTIGFHQDMVISQIMPNKLIDFYKKAKEELSQLEFDKMIKNYPDLYKLSNEVSEEENPILCFFRIK